MVSNLNPNIYFDGAYFSAVPDSVRNEIAKYSKQKDVDSGRISFCGFVYEDESFHLFLPKGSEKVVNFQDALGRARLLFGALEKYYRSDESFLNRDGKSSLAGDPQIFPLIKDILKDFNLNGFYTNSSYYKKRGHTGKTDWPSTIKKLIPYLSDNNVIYPDFINRLPDHRTSSEITSIHEWVLQDISRKFGWLFANTPLEIIPINTKKSLLNFSKSIHLIKNEMRIVYSESKIYTLKNLLRYLEKDLVSGDKGAVAYGFNDFQWVWEHMLKRVLEPTANFNMPYPAYLDSSEKIIPMIRKGQRVDIFLHDEDSKRGCVVDAKYYIASNPSNAPGWPDLVKQFFYAKSLLAGSVNTSVKYVQNYFIFPGKPSAETPLEAFVLDKDGKTRLDNDFPPIACCFVNPDEVLNSYVSGTVLISLRNRLLDFNAG